jgi:hypothetical protein
VIYSFVDMVPPDIKKRQSTFAAVYVGELNTAGRVSTARISFSFPFAFSSCYKRGADQSFRFPQFNARDRYDKYSTGIRGRYKMIPAVFR